MEALDSLPPWSHDEPFSDEDWAKYVEAARQVQEADPETITAVLDAFIKRAASEECYENESKPFLLMRLVFDLPEAAPERERFSFKGWANWPAPDSRGYVSLAWPLSWRSGRPEVVAAYAGSAGRSYAASEEYRYLRERFPYRDLEGAMKETEENA